MSAYTRAYQGLTAGGMREADAAALLAELRQDHGTEFAAGLRGFAAETYAAGPTDSRATHRLKKRQHGAVRKAATWLLAACAMTASTTPGIPGQRTNGSNT